MQEEGLLNEAESHGYPKDKLVFLSAVTAVVASCVPAAQENLICLGKICLGKGREGRPARGCELEHLPVALPLAKAGFQHSRTSGSHPRGILEFLSMRCIQREISGSTWNYLFSMFCYGSACFWSSLCLFLVLGAPVWDSYTGTFIIMIINSFNT